MKQHHISSDRYGWLICGVSFLAQALTFGFYNTFGSLFVAIIKEYDATETEAAWVGSISYSLALLSGSITSPLCSKIGCRQVACIGAIIYGLGLLFSSFGNNVYILYVTYGGLFAMGTSAVYFSSILVLPLYFDHSLSNAIGFATSGIGVGGLAVGPLLEYCLTHYGIRMTFRLFALLSLPLFLGGLLYERKLRSMKLPRGAVKIKMCNQSTWKNGGFIIFVLSICIIFFGYYIPYVHLVRLAMDINVDAYSATLLLGYISISQSVGKIIFGKLGGVPSINRLYLNQACLLVVSLAQTLCPLSTSYSHLVLYSCVFGFFDGCFSTHLVLLIGDIVGKENLSAGIGALYTVASLFTMLGPPFAGFLYTATGSYDVAFFVCGGTLTLAICLQFLIPWFLPSRDSKSETQFESVIVEQKRISGLETDKDESQLSYDSGIAMGNEAWVTGYQDTILLDTNCNTDTRPKTGASLLSIFDGYNHLAKRTTSVDVLYSLTTDDVLNVFNGEALMVVDKVTTV